MDRYGFLILAAGSSSRLGKPKQLLAYKNKPLLQHCIDIAKEVNDGPVFTVLGANAETIQGKLPLHREQTIINHNWQQGMGSTISMGMKVLIQTNPELGAAILLVCDQPHMTATLLKFLIQTHEEKQKAIIACSYSNTLGTPVLFEKRFFDELAALQGQEGAKKIIYRHPEAVEAVDFPQGEIDIDTVEDYNQLQGGFI